MNMKKRSIDVFQKKFHVFEPAIKARMRLGGGGKQKKKTKKNMSSDCRAARLWQHGVKDITYTRWAYKFSSCIDPRVWWR